MKENKEQKTVTALQFLLTETNSPEFTHELDELCENYLCISQIMEQYAKAKVLEALESDLKDLFDCYNAHLEDNPKKEVCIVLHTLITEKQEQIEQVKQK